MSLLLTGDACQSCCRVGSAPGIEYNEPSNAQGNTAQGNTGQDITDSVIVIGLGSGGL
jgi:hypothetical protein